MPIRFQHGGAYIADIGALRNQIRANGTVAHIQAIPVSHPLQPAANLTVFVNLAYQPNGALAPANASVYLVGIGNANGNWHFNIGGVAGLPGAAFPGNPDGSYNSLGYAHPPLPNITDATLSNAVAALSGYNGGALNAALLDSLARVIVAVSEAARFSDVSGGVAGVLGNAGAYAPNLGQLHAWGGHTLGG